MRIKDKKPPSHSHRSPITDHRSPSSGNETATKNINDYRKQARQIFNESSWPDPKNEVYRRTDLDFLRENKISLKPIGFSMELTQAAPGVIKPLGGSPTPKLFGQLIEARQGKFQALSAADFTDGVLIETAPGDNFEKPFIARLGFESQNPEGCFLYRNLISLAKGSRLTYIEESNGRDNLPRFQLGATEIFLEEGSELNYVVIQELTDAYKSFLFESAHLGPGSKLNLYHFEAGAGLRYLNIASHCAKPNATSNLTTAMLGKKNQNFDAYVVQRHQAPHTQSDMLWKTALWDKSKSSFLGLIQIEKGADGTQAFQTTHNLLLSDQAKAIPDPRLEILADDVQAKHAATAGHIDEEQLFYLESRGIDRDQAEKIMTRGFFAETLQRLPPSAHWEIELRLERHLDGV
ncbi:MAG: SufD family Fe-S cluster assembly protein [Elusimicrobia bacterium]|nr:SufD family Fe-S cluster assembly protein [Elusimicrobiota bacterium]